MAKELDLSAFDGVKETVEKELDLSAFDAGQPTLTVPEEDPYTKTESALLGGVQGASLGFADEIEAGLRSAVGSKSYDSLINEVRDRYKSAEAENPMSYTGGNLAGSFVVPAGAFGAAAKGATFATKAGIGALSGAAAGAAGTLGSTEKDVLSLGTGKEVLTNAAVGGTLGAAFPVAGKLVQKTDDVLENAEFYRVLKNIYNKAEDGKSLFGKVVEEKDKARKLSGDIVEGFQASKEKAGRDLGSANKALSQKAVPLSDLTEELGVDLASKKGLTPDGQKSVNDLQATLNSIVGKTEVESSRYIPKNEMPKPSGISKSEESVVKSAAKKNLLEEERLRTSAKELKALANKSPGSPLASKSEEEIYTVLKKSSKTYGPDVDNVIDEVTGREAAKIDDIINVAGKTPEPLFTPLERVVSKTTQFDRAAVPLDELKSVVQELSVNLSGNGTNIPATARNSVQKVKDALQNVLDKESAGIANLSELNANYKQAGKANAMLNMPENFGSSFADDAAKTNRIGVIQDQVESFSKDSSKNKQILLDAIKELRVVQPGLADRIERKVRQQGLDLESAKVLTKKSGLGQSSGVLGSVLQLGAETLPANVANLAGIAVNRTKGAATKLGNLSRSVIESSPEGVQQLAAKVKDSKLAAKLSNIAQQPDRKRKAMLFTLMQDPGFRYQINTDESEEGQ